MESNKRIFLHLLNGAKNYKITQNSTKAILYGLIKNIKMNFLSCIKHIIGSFSYKRKSAQQLVEFALVVPIFMIILVSLIEIGFALNLRLSLAEAVKMSIMQSNQLFESPGTGIQKVDALRKSLESSIQNYFIAHSLPYSDTISVTIKQIANSKTALVIARYAYIPVFTLPNIFGGKVIPDQYDFTSTQIINDTLLRENKFKSYLTTSNLSSFDKTAGNFDPRTSVLRDQGILIDPATKIDSRNLMGFLVGFNGSSYHNDARLFNWWGEDLLPPNIAIDMASGNLIVKSPYYNSGNWLNTNIPYTWVLTSFGFTQAIYARMDSLASFNNFKFDLTSSDTNINAGIPWFNQTNCSTCGHGDSADPFMGNLSNNTIDNLNKRGLSFLFGSTGTATGSYENLIINSGSTSPSPIRNYT